MKIKIPLLIILTIAVVLSLSGCSLLIGGHDDGTIDLRYTHIDETMSTNATYTGKPIFPKFKILNKKNIPVADFTKTTENSDLKVTLSNNVNVGTASVLVEAKPESKNFTGSISFTFKIIPVAKVAADVDSLIAYLSDKNYTSVSLGDDMTIPEDASITVYKGTGFHTNGYNLVNNGSITVFGRFSIESQNNGYRTSRVENNGKIDFQNKDGYAYLDAAENTSFYNKGTLSLYSSDLKGNREEGSYLLSDTPILDHYKNRLFEKVDSSTYFFVRRPLDTYNIEIEDNDYTEKKVYPDIRVTYPGYNGYYDLYKNSECIFENNINAGTATVKITATNNSKYFTGEVTKQFTIKKPNISIDESKYDSLDQKLANENYNEITLIGNYPNKITIPQNAKLVIQDCIALPDIVNNGKLTIKSTQEKPANITEETITKINTLTNNGTVDIDLNAFIVNGTLNGNGVYNASGETYLSKEANISDITFTNDKNVYFSYDYQITGLDTHNRNFIKREEFKVSEHLNILNNNEPYRKNYSRSIKCAFQKNGLEIDCPKNTYSCTGASDVTDAGKYPFSIAFSVLSKEFYGSDEGLFLIDKTDIVLTEKNDLYKILSSNNYRNITIDAPIFVVQNGKHSIVPKDTTIIISKNGALYNNTFVSDSLTKSCLIVLGKIENNGIYAELGYRNLSLRPEADEDSEGDDVGTFINNGKAYFNKVTEERKTRIRRYGDKYPVLTTGSSFIRETDLKDASREMITDTCTFAYKNGKPDTDALIPDYKLSISGVPLVKATELDSQNGDFVICAYNNKHISSELNKPYSVAKACYTSEKVYGITGYIYYTISAGETTVSDFNELKNVLSYSYYVKGEVENSNGDFVDYIVGDWELIELTGDVIYNGTRNIEILIPPNTSLRTKKYTFDLVSSERDSFYNNYYCRIYNHGKIYTSVWYNTTFSLEDYSPCGKGKIIGEAYSREEFEQLIYYDEVNLMADIQSSINNYVEIDIKADGTYVKNPTLTINLNGHKIDYLKISAERKHIIVNGDGADIHYLDLEGIGNKIDERRENNHSFELNNFTIYRIEYETSWEKEACTLNNMTITEERIYHKIDIPKQ